MITDTTSEGYRIAEELARTFRVYGEATARKCWDDYQSQRRAEGKPIVRWVALAILDTFNALIKRAA